ncbi:hypothetical protein [Chitinilyticum aquatile]|uniref:hypothetical protein n=1 Tax=Chitinilyticum aquatile TaxID=362520 RepID=UPI00040B59BD|nr:hypothetical protein [Chitinilyticum aquatile]
MSNISSIRAFSAQMSQTLVQGAQQTMGEVLQNAERLDRKKGNIAEAGLERVQQSNAIAEKNAEQRQRIDIFV